MRCVHPGKKRFDLVEPTRAGSRRLTSQTTCQGWPPGTGLRPCKQKRERERCLPFPVSCLGLRGACHPEEAFSSCFFFCCEGKGKRRIVSADVLFTLEVMRLPRARQPAGADASRFCLLLVVVRALRRLALDMLQHGLNLRPRQKARTQGLILDALCQPSDDGRCLPKGRARLHRQAFRLIHPAQRRLDLPLLCWQSK